MAGYDQNAVIGGLSTQCFDSLVHYCRLTDNICDGEFYGIYIKIQGHHAFLGVIQTDQLQTEVKQRLGRSFKGVEWEVLGHEQGNIATVCWCRACSLHPVAPRMFFAG